MIHQSEKKAAQSHCGWSSTTGCCCHGQCKESTTPNGSPCYQCSTRVVVVAITFVFTPAGVEAVLAAVSVSMSLLSSFCCCWSVVQHRFVPPPHIIANLFPLKVVLPPLEKLRLLAATLSSSPCCRHLLQITTISTSPRSSAKKVWESKMMGWRRMQRHSRLLEYMGVCT